MQEVLKELKGVIPAVFTPFSDGGELNLSVLPRYLEFLLKAGCDGFFVGGGNGECFTQNVEERLRFADAFSRELGGEKPVILHVGAINPLDAYRLAAKGRDLKVDAISAVVPFYYPYGIREIAAYYRELAERSERPLIVYYVPGDTGQRLGTKDFIEHIISISGVAGVKYTHSDLYQMQSVTAGFQGRVVSAYGGVDQMGVCFLSMGARGLIGATVNLVPEVYTRMVAAFDAGDMAEAMRLQRVANGFSLKIKRRSRSSYKAFMVARGIELGAPRVGWESVDGATRAELAALAEETLKQVDLEKWQ